jgi:hypothetical protein
VVQIRGTAVGAALSFQLFWPSKLRASSTFVPPVAVTLQDLTATAAPGRMLKHELLLDLESDLDPVHPAGRVEDHRLHGAFVSDRRTLELSIDGVRSRSADRSPLLEKALQM